MWVIAYLEPKASTGSASAVGGLLGTNLAAQMSAAAAAVARPNAFDPVGNGDLSSNGSRHLLTSSSGRRRRAPDSTRRRRGASGTSGTNQSCRRRTVCTTTTRSPSRTTTTTATSYMQYPTPTPTPRSGSSSGGAAGGGAAAGVAGTIYAGYKKGQADAETIENGASVILTGKAVAHVLGYINSRHNVNDFPTLTACDLMASCPGKKECQEELGGAISTEADKNAKKALCELYETVESWKGEKETNCCRKIASDCCATVRCKGTAENDAEKKIIRALNQASAALIESYEEAGVDIDKKLLLLALYSDITRGNSDSTLRAKMVKEFRSEEIDANELKTFEAVNWEGNVKPLFDELLKVSVHGDPKAGSGRDRWQGRDRGVVTVAPVAATV